jgi:hypothetical protein
MLHAKAKLFTLGTEVDHFGSEYEIGVWLNVMFPEFRDVDDFKEKVKSINDEGRAEVEVIPVEAPKGSNMLPPDYLTHDEIGPEDEK